ncbi:MAG: hypothetical protein P8X43_02830 [Maritimibacter sp.]
MYQAFLTIWRTPALRIATLTMFAAGFGSAATYPYLSLVALDQLGLSEQHFGLILLAAAVLATLNAVIISHFSWRWGRWAMLCLRCGLRCRVFLPCCCFSARLCRPPRRSFLH